MNEIVNIIRVCAMEALVVIGTAVISQSGHHPYRALLVLIIGTVFVVAAEAGLIGLDADYDHLAARDR